MTSTTGYSSFYFTGKMLHGFQAAFLDNTAIGFYLMEQKT